MRFFDRGTIANRLRVLTGCMLMLSVMMGVCGYWGLKSVGEVVTHLGERSMPGLVHSSNLMGAIGRYRAEVWRHVATVSPEDKRKAEASQVEIVRELEREFGLFQSTLSSAEEAQRLAALKSAWAEYTGIWEGQIRPASQQGTPEGNLQAFTIASTTGRQAFGRVMGQMQSILDGTRSRSKELVEEGRATTERADAIFLFIGLVGGGGCLGIAIAIGMALQKRLTEVVREVSGGSSEVRQAAMQLAQTSAKLAQGASEQAASIEETSASSNEISSMANRNGEQSQRARESMTSSRTRYNETEAKVERLSEAMSEINNASKKIGQILGTIDTIAFQTNVLALNASVEAARAGSAGMGFAVVAEEVRNLAQRCATAAKETAGLVELTVKSGKSGSERLSEVVAAMRGVDEQTAGALIMVETVSENSKQQSEGLRQINIALSQVEQVTQRIAAASEESAAASDELVGQSNALGQALSGLEELVGA